MKRVLFLLLILSFFFSSKAQITWDGGGGDGLWATAANWFGNIVPGSADDVALDNSHIAGPYTVTLPGGSITTTIKSLVITSGGSHIITLVLPNTNTNDPGLQVTGAGDAVVLNFGAILKNSSGASSGDGISITNTFRINNFGHYIHNTTRGNAGLVSQLSTTAGTEYGEFEYDVPAGSYTPSFSNRTYGTLTFSALANGGTATYIGSGINPLNIKGHLQLNTGVTLSLSMSADCIVHNNLIQSSSSIFNLQNSTNSNTVLVRGNISSSGTLTKSGSGLPELLLNGTSNQNITVTGTITNNVTLNINNAAGATLLSTLTLPYHLELTNGRLNTTSAFLLVLLDNATSSAGSSNSFVSGPMKKIGNDNFTFPLGLGSIYAPISIANVSGELISDQFTAEYKRANPQSTSPYGPGVTSDLNHVSYVEYWKLEQNVGTAVKNIALDVHLTSFCKVLTSTYVARWDGFAWSKLATNVTSGPAIIGGYETGTIASTGGVSGFLTPTNAFTLGTDLSYSANPLPINLIAFDAYKFSSSKALLSWELSACCSSSTKFELQRAGGDKNFKAIATMAGSETNRFYNYTDNGLQGGVNFYRLKMTDADGAVAYSKTVAVLNGTQGLLLTSLIPSVVSHTAALTIASSSAQKIDVLIVDMQGRVVQKRSHLLMTGNTTLVISAGMLPAGAYQLLGISAEGKTNVIRFIKQ